MSNSISLPKFPVTKPSLHAELKGRIQKYFEDNKIKSTGNFKLFSKTIILGLLFASLYVHLVFFTPAIWLAVVECVLLGLVVSAIGFNVMHDGGHGSYSTKKFVNKVAALSSDFLGANSFLWHVKHNIIHHTYTNVEGIDDDLESNGILRFTTTQPKRKLHKYQHLYFWFFYSILYLWWVFGSDYKKYFTKKIGDVPLKHMTTENHVSFWLGKIVHLTVFIILPIIYVGALSWVAGFFMVTLVSGFSLSIVFQLAHTVTETSFPVAQMPENKLEDEFALHQLKTTANFAMNSKLVSWFVGGLNFQIEHHLFPKVSHIHYPAISKIVQQVCKEYGAPYINNNTLWKAVTEHVKFLKQMGTMPNSIA